MRDFTAAHVWDGIRFSRGDVHIMVRSRVSPPRRALDCLDVEAARALGPVPIQREARRVVTAEGEYGALLLAHSATRVVEVGVVYGEHVATEIIGEAPLAELDLLDTAVAELTHVTALGLGEGRPRWFLHDAPPGGAKLARGLVADYQGPGAVIRVFPARRPGAARRWLDDACLAGVDAGAALPVVEDLLIGGMIGSLRSGDEAGQRVARAELEDDRHVYTLTLVAAPEAFGRARALFRRVVESMRPLPAAAPAVEWQPCAITMDHWCS